MYNPRSYIKIVMFFLIVIVSIRIFDARAQNEAFIEGIVLDEEGKPIEGASVGVFASQNFRKFMLTDSEGRFYTVSNRQGWHEIYAFYDEKETRGLDYVPGRYWVSLQYGSTTSLKFVLLKGASIYLEGDVMFVESNTPVNYFRFSVDLPLLLTDNLVDVYGSQTDLVRWFGFNERLVIVPADIEVKIEVRARITSVGVEHKFIAKGIAGYFKMSQGESLSLDIREYSMNFNFGFFKDLWDSSLELLEDCEDAGFLVNVERDDLMTSYSYFKESLFTFSQDSYDTAFSKIRNAYLLTQSSFERLQGLIKISGQSAFQLLFLFVFVASATAYLVAGREEFMLEVMVRKARFSLSINLLLATTFYVMQVLFFYLLFPGCHLVPASNFAVASVFSIVVGQGILIVSSRFFSERQSQRHTVQFRSAMLSAFSMACRNLRRRKFRTILTLISMSILVFGFIMFTSISPGFGLVAKSLKPSHSVDALLIKNLPEGSEQPFVEIPNSFLSWLETQPNITVIAPKLENTPFSIDYPYYLYSEASQPMSVLGMIGIIPSLESNLISLNKIIVEGDFLEDSDLQEILVAYSLRERLGVNVGDKLYGFDQVFTIKGFFDDILMSTCKDIDGESLLPHYIEPMTGPVPCNSADVIILVYETALTLPRIATSRVLLQFASTEDYPSYSELIAITREYRVYEAHSGSLTLNWLARYVEQKGMALVPFLMLLVMLNIIVSFFGSVRERRNEIASLSSVGLNPTHIATLFIAEGAIIGFIGGGLGYLLGLAGYRTALTGLLGALQVREKVSAEWGLIALLLAGCSSIIASFIPAIQASTIVTPSLLRKWQVKETEKPRMAGQPWILGLPVKLMIREIEPFMGFMVKRMRETGEITRIKVQEEKTLQGPIKKILFRFSQASEQISGGGLWTDNILIIKKSETEHLDVELHCLPYKKLEDLVHRTASNVRKLIFEWNSLTFELAALYDPHFSQLYTLVNAYSPTQLYIITKELDISNKLEEFRKGLVLRGIRSPKFYIAKVDSENITNIMDTAEKIVSRADIVCISGEESKLAISLAFHATRQKKIICYVVDDRPKEIRAKEPFRELRIVITNQ